MQKIYAMTDLRSSASFRILNAFTRTLLMGLFFSSPFYVAAQFTAGNLVVLQVGDGTAALSSAGTPLFMKEFTPAGVAGISVTIPSSGATQMVLSGTATSEGMLSRSSDGQLLVFGGYAAPAGTAAVAGTSAGTVNRAVGTVSASGTFTRVATSATFYSTNNIRSAAADGSNNFWANGNGTASTGGTNYFGNSSAQSNVQSATTNTRSSLISNSNLYFSTGSGTVGIYQVGTGLPVTSGQTLTAVFATGAGSSPYQFFFNSTQTICYVADDRAVASGGGIQKWVFSSGVWSLAYTLATATGTTLSARGVVADFSGTNPIVYATTGETSGNRLVKIIDTGAGSTATTIATAATNTLFRGLAFAPQVSCPTFSSAPANATITNSTCASACTVSGGVITAPSGTPCPAGSTLQYQVNGGSWTSTLPTYAQTGPAQTIKTRCSCDSDNTNNSAESAAVTTVPGTCIAPTASISVTETSGTTNDDGIICVGASATLTATGGTSYAWSNGTNTAANPVTPASTTTYTVTVTNANGCTATSSSTITVNPLPTPGINVAETSGTTNNDGIICAGASATLTGTGGTSYVWSNGVNMAANPVTPASTTTYTVTVTNANGCTATSSSTITVNPLPTPGINVTETSGTTNNDGIICAGASATLTGTGGTSYAWSNGVNTAANPVTPASTTTYTVTVTNANGCTATSSSTITVNPLPTPVINVTETSGTTNNDGIICAGASATLTGTGGTSYAWSNGVNTAANPVTPASTTTYTVTVTNANGCIATSSATITVNALPNVNFSYSPNDTVCVGTLTTITASGGTSYSWNTGAATASIMVTPAFTTLYTVTVTNSAGCTRVGFTQLYTIAIPNITTSVVQPTTCVSTDGSITANAPGAFSYLWSTGAATATISNLVVGTYTVTVTNFSLCTNTAVVTLVGPGGCSTCPTIPTVTAVLSPICAGGSSTLTASGLTSMGNTYGIIFKSFPAATATPYTGGTVLATVANGSLTSGGTVATAVVTFPTSGTNFIYAILTPNPSDPACRPSATTTLVVNALPTPGITVTETSGTINNDGIICAGASATLTASGGTSYAWNNGVNAAANTITPASTTTYTVTVTNANGCTASSTSTITVNPLPTPGITVTETSGTINNDGIICAGASATLTGTGGTSYAWNNGVNTAANPVTPASTTTYTVTVTNANGCTASSTSTITVNPLPTPGITVTETSGTINNDGIICAGASATLTGTGGTSYAWNNGVNTAANPVTPASTTTYTVTVTNANGCTASSTSTITVNPLPSASITATPNPVSLGAVVNLSVPTAGGGATYNWAGNGIVNTNANATTATPTTGGAQVYSVTVTNSNGCTATGTATVTVTPVVTLSVSANAGTEANNTSITVTATASGAVSGNQTVTLAISGAGITASDYYLTNAIITILSGQTTGTATFVIADDATPESTETAILTLTTPSSGIVLGSPITQNIVITNNACSFLNRLSTTVSTNGSEVPAFDPGSKRVFTVAGSIIEVFTMSNTGTLTLVGPLALGFTPPAGTIAVPNSVSSKNGIIAASYAVVNSTTNAQSLGQVTFYNAATGAVLNSVQVGYLPDMLTFTPDGQKVLTANEGEPNSYGQGTSFDPEGSISIINIAGGVASASVTMADFTAFNPQIASLRAAGVRIYGPGATVAQDLEPEYIAVAPDGLSARVTLQENNAMAVLDLVTNTITAIQPLGLKNHNLAGNGLDASDRDLTSSTGKINIQNWPIFGMYLPDEIASYSVGGQTYYVTANEGDSRNYTGYSEEIRVGAAGYVLDPGTFPNAATLKLNNNLGRLQLSNATGDTDNDGDFDQIHALGARSFSVWNSSGALVFDSGDQMEQLTAAKVPSIFNAEGTTATFDTRSDNKGPEPEGVKIGYVSGVPYAFVGLERVGDVIVYDISNPAAPVLVQYMNVPQDLAVEDLAFVPAAQSPTGNALLITAAEASFTITVYEIGIPDVSIALAETSGTANNDGITCAGATATLTASGGGTYLWSTGASTAAINVNPNTTTTYTVTVTNTAGCTASNTRTITVNPLPTTAINVAETSGIASNDGIICIGASADLTATGGGTYAWSTGATTATISVTPNATTTYTVTVTNANNCSATSTRTITVNPLPTGAIGVTETSGVANNDGTICLGATATLTASGGTSYAWNTGENTAAINVTPATTTTYTVTVTNANGCSGTSTRTITVNPLPTVNITGNTTACIGATVTLTATGGGTYLWATGETTASISFPMPGAPSIYCVTVTNNGCTSSNCAALTPLFLPTAGTTVTETSGTTANDGIICAGASATITGTGGTSYAWSTGANTAAITVTPAATTTYTVTVTNANGCTATTTRTITVNPLPTPATTVAETSGTTNNDGIICLGASATITASGGTAYIWSTGAATAAITVTPAATTTYTVTVTNANGCTATSTRTITVNPLPTAFTVTGGGGYCLGTDPGTLVGLSGSQTGVNYQLQLNNVNIGAPVAGTGNVLSFGNQLGAGNYTIIATNIATGCSVSMTGLVNVFSFNCNATISDPCVCLNNATTLTNGQFGEQIKINAPSNQTWTVSAVTGLYTIFSPAPPAAPTAITVGTVLANIGGNMFTLDGRHIDALGYTISVTNGAGTTLSIGNSCQYPNPAITSDLSGDFCLYSDVVNLTGTPGDANIVSAVFTVNGVVATQFNPGAGVGQYVIEYTVNGGTPKAFGANDPGCIQKVSNTVNVIATPSQLACNDLVYLSLDVDCISEINPDDILEGSYGCFDDYLVELDETLPYGNGPWVPAVVGAGDVGKTYQVRVTHLVTGNKCWGNIKIEDKLEPTIVCKDITLFCPITNYEPNYLKNTLGIAAAFPTVTDCSNYTLNYIDTYKDLACGQGFNGVNDLSAYVIRKWTAKDAWGNESICTQYIYFKRLHVDDVLFPADFTISCNSNNINTNPSVTGVPFVKAFGINWGLFPDPGFCELQAAYADQILPVCDGTYKILRTWTVIDWCLPTTPFPPSANPQYYIQLIKVVDDKGPTLACPVDITVTTDPYTCCATSNLPDVILEDNCSRINNIGGMVTTFDPYTGQQLAMYTIGGSLTSFPGNNLWDLDTLGNWGNTPCLPIGTHRVVYTAEDDCGNTSTCSFRLTVADYVPPVAACDQYTVASVISDDPFDCYEPADGCDGAGVTWIKATTFDDGSYDNCNNLKFTVRRMAPYSDCINNLQDCEKPRATEEQDSIKFYCCEVGTTQTVILRVYQVDLNGQIMNGPDGTPLYNECMVNVEVQDKIKPVCVPPANVTVSCENFDPSLWAYGKPGVFDNCCLDKSKVYQGQCGLTHTVNLSLFDTVCNKGTITRTFRAFDCHGQSSQCTQRVVVNYEQDYFVRFPNDVIVSVCDGTGNYGAPTFFGEDCELLGVSFEDEIFTVVPDACFKIERTWTVINWCTYNPNLGCINVPNPNPNAITNAPANLPGVTVSPAGTPTPWNPTVVKINPTDAQATNYSIFYDANANCYRYKQIIKVIDTQDPTVTAPTSPVEYCDLTPNDAQLWNQMYWWDNTISSHDLCEGDADLSITGTDACSGSNISFRYLLFLDLDGDNVMETVVSSTNLPGVNNVQFGNATNANYTGGQPRAFDGRPVPFNQQYRFGLDWTTSGTSATAKVRFDNLQSPIALPGTGNNVMQGVVPQLPYGTHKIKWFVEDGCGNETISEYTFVVKDCKKPTVVCLNGLSVNIMPTQMIQLWASDFLQYTEDNCTPASQLKIAIRKSSDPTPGFPVDAQGNPITNVTFTCGELGTQLVKLWSIDKAGNADYCETYVIVQDNNGNCPPSSGAAKVAGALATEAVNGVQDGNVEIAGSGNGIPSFTFTTMSNATGVYNFNAIPLATNSTVTPAKDDNPLNGVSTYDLVLISKHILGIESLNSPYKMIAADANKSGSITTFDIVELRKLILGIYTDLPNNTSWRFVDKSYVFPNLNNPFQATFAENKSIVNLSGNLTSEDFVSVKVGDVNGNAIANAAMASDDRSSGTLLFDIMDRAVTVGSTFTVDLKAAEAVAGYQFTMNFKGLEVVDITPGANMTMGNFGVFSDAITTSYDGPNQGAFSVTFRALKGGKLSELLSVSSQITKAEAYSTSANASVDKLAGPASANASADKKLNVAFRFNNGNTSTVSGVGFELYQNQPNPFVNKTVIGFHLPEATTATLSIYDETGRVIYNQKAAYAKGYNAVTIDRALLNTVGLLYYKLETATDSATKKMIQTK